MRFGVKILLALAGVGILPIAFMGWISYRVSQRELERTVGRMQLQAAEDLGSYGERFVSSALDALSLSLSYVPFEQFSRSELSAVLQIPYHQLRFLRVLAIVDDQGKPLAGPVFERHPERDPSLVGREAVLDHDLELFARRIPPAPPQPGAVAVGSPYRTAQGAARLPVAIRIRSRQPRVLAAELSLAELERHLSELPGSEEVAVLLDREGRPVAGAPSGLGSAAAEVARAAAAAGDSLSRVVRGGDGAGWLAGAAPVGKLGWSAVVAQPATSAFRAADRLRANTLLWAGLAVGLTAVLGILLVRGLMRPVRRLTEAVSALGAGTYETPIAAQGRDEFSQLERAFDRMALEIRRRGEEIRRWNRELMTRVEERTAELKAAQDQIIRARRLAALGSLGAGIAHELNNPMTAISGYLTILKKRLGSADGDMVEKALEQAQRVSRIVDDLRRFADQELTGSGRRFSLASPVRAALELYADRLRAGQIQLATRFDEPLPEVQGDPVQLQQVVAHLVDNAINAMPEGGALDVSVSSVEGDALKLCVADTGRGIPSGIRERIFDPFFTTKERPGRVGLGLSLSHSIVEAHHGRIVVENRDGAGAAFTVLLPAAAAAAHLR